MIKVSTRRAARAVALAIFALAFAMPEGRAQVQNPVLPSLSTARAKFFHDNPAARDQFISQLPRHPAGPPQPSTPVTPPVLSNHAARQDAASGPNRKTAKTKASASFSYELDFRKAIT